MSLLPGIIILIISLSAVHADTPANCTFDDILGEWQIKETRRALTGTVNCSNFEIDDFNHTQVITLKYPDLAVDDQGNYGYWTIIYNQGFEFCRLDFFLKKVQKKPKYCIKINNRIYFAFSEYEVVGNITTSDCHLTKRGWAHDIFVRDWSCYVASKVFKNDSQVFMAKESTFSDENHSENMNFYKFDENMIANINKHQNHWVAGTYDWSDYTVADIFNRCGGDLGRYTGPTNKTSAKSDLPLTTSQKDALKRLPAHFDWRNVDGQNFMSPVRDQGHCGSCYSFASMGMMEARYRIASNNTQTPVFSPQDVVQCSLYSQGCKGGFPYLIAGKYAQDYGMVLEECNEYHLPVVEGKCQTDQTCRRYFARDYSYVGNFYGGCNEPLMKLALVKNGPLAVYDDFLTYKSGIYHHTGKGDRVNFNHDPHWHPFELTNHVVVITGYGTDAKTGQDYWIVKNSWGKTWGEHGYFRIRRGNDECDIESLAAESFPIITY